jgi:hypothetical protein
LTFFHKRRDLAGVKARVSAHMDNRPGRTPRPDKAIHFGEEQAAFFARHLRPAGEPPPLAPSSCVCSRSLPARREEQTTYRIVCRRINP